MRSRPENCEQKRHSRPVRVPRAAVATVTAAVRAGVKSYDRARDLPRLIHADPFSPIPEDAEGTAAIVARLERALRAERNRARSGHWTYDLNRHIALRQAFLAETERLISLQSRPDA
jgi:hypothetical protein